MKPLSTCLSLTRLFVLALACLALPAQAEDASFNSSTGILTLPVVNAPGTGILRATLSLTSSNPIVFTLQSAEVYATAPALDSFTVQVNNGNTLHIPRVIVGNEYYSLNLGLLSTSPFTFGNIQVLSVTQIPAPTPDPLQASITAGQSKYADLCGSCHGVSGNGTASAPSVVDSSFSTFASLRTKINNTMPLGSSASCVDSGSSTCATDIANYIINRLR